MEVSFKPCCPGKQAYALYASRLSGKDHRVEKVSRASTSPSCPALPMQKEPCFGTYVFHGDSCPGQ